MEKKNNPDRKQFKQSECCAYKKCCYLADELECFGYKIDCVLYLKSNNEFFTRKSFDEAVNRLIDKTRARFEGLTITA